MRRSKRRKRCKQRRRARQLQADARLAGVLMMALSAVGRMTKKRLDDASFHVNRRNN